MRLEFSTAIRQMRRAPGTAAAAVLTLAIGIGATAAIVTFVGAVMSAASPAPDMARLVGLWSHNRGEAETKSLVSPGDYVEWVRRAQSFSALAAWRGQAFNVSGVGSPVRIPAQLVTPHYFAIFGWRPTMGRVFTDADARPGAPGVVVVSHTFWEQMLARRPDVVGHTLRLDGAPATIVGVLPWQPGVSGLFVPLAPDPQDRSSRTLFVHARLAEGASIDRARDEMAAIGRALEIEFPTTNRGWAVNTRPLQEEFVGPQARLIFALLIAVVLAVLLIGCVNIANLLLARVTARRGELAVRLALGASRWRLVRQLVIECAVLAGLGGLLSLVVSRWTLSVLVTLGAVDSPWLANGGLNPRALMVTAAASLLATLVAGLVPGLLLGDRRTAADLQATGRSAVASRQRLTRWLVAAQVTLAVALLVIAGLATRTFIAVQRLDPGFDMSHLLTATVTLPDGMGLEAAARWVDDVVARARVLPGVVSAGATSRLPFAGSRWNPNRGLEIEGQAPLDSAAGHWAVDYVTTPGFVETLRVPLLDGRSFTDRDGADAPPVVLVNQAMVRRYWPGQSPLGARLRQGDDPRGLWRTVVGVVGDIRNDDADQPPLPYVYVPLQQRPRRTMTLTLRTTGEPAALAEPLRRAVQDFDPEQALYDIQTMEAVWEADLRGTRVLIDVMGALALIALGLAGLGLWGVAAHSVGQRTREIGVRVALGARPADIGRLIGRQGLGPIAIGLAAGLGAGLAAGRLMRSILFQVTPADPVTLATTMAALALVGLAATLGPAVRASRLDPLAALRQE